MLLDLAPRADREWKWVGVRGSVLLNGREEVWKVGDKYKGSYRIRRRGYDGANDWNIRARAREKRQHEITVLTFIET